MIQFSLAAGHGDLHEQIIEISTKIVSTPDNPQLWLTRAQLHQSHRNPKAALHDLQQATRIEPSHPPAFLKLAQFERKLGHFPRAQKALNAYFTLISDSTPDPQAHREKALLSDPTAAAQSWRLFLKNTESPAMHDFALAAQAALDANDSKTSREFLLAGLNHHPKSIQLHQIHAQVSLSQLDSKSAEASFKTLKLLYPNLLVKLNYEESLIWSQHKKSTRANQALLAALRAFHKLPSRLQKNRDLLDLVAKIEITLRK